MLIGRASGLRVVGDRRWPASRELRAVLAENEIAHQWLDPAEDPAAQTLLAEIGSELDSERDTRPVVLAADGRVLLDPSLDDLMRAAASARTW